MRDWCTHWVQSLGKKLGGRKPPVLAWCLDYPSPDREPRFVPSGRVVQGWVLLPGKSTDALSSVRVVCHLQPTFELCCPLNVERPDVVERVLNDSPADHPQLGCGFRFTVPPDLAMFALSLEIKGQRWPLQQVKVAPHTPEDAVLKVLRGKNNWLFLDNDTNFSVDQFAGYMRLTDQGLASWADYASALEAGFDGLGRPAVMLVAPTKESVLGRYHPMTAATVPMLQPVFDLLPQEQLIYPAIELRDALGDEAFFKTDTHWTQKGAGLASALVAKRLGAPPNRVDRLLAKDRYKTREHAGDLGNKLRPRVYASASFLSSFNYRKWVVYDNGLPNFGRMMVIHYPKALVNETFLVFGSSSSYSMFNYLCRFFRRLIFVHSAGNIDPELIKVVEPDSVVAQTNARFMIRPPVADYSLKQTIHTKQRTLDEAGREKQSKQRYLGDMELVNKLGLAPWHERVPLPDDNQADSS